MNKYDLIKGLGVEFLESGFSLYFVGGCVRDRILEREPKDIDLVTDAPTESIISLVRDISDNFHEIDGLVRVLALNGDIKIEISTIKGGNILEDALDRDFTINAIYMGAQPTNWLSIYDPVGGFADLSAKVLKTPANPEVTIGNDPVRIIRAARFYSELHCRGINELALDAMNNLVSKLEWVPKERIQAEIMKIMESKAPAEAMLFLDKIDAVKWIFPRLEYDRDFMVNSRHQLFWHLIDTLKKASELTNDPEIRLAALLHDTGKFSLNEDHANISAENAKAMLRDLKFSNATINRVFGLIKRHMDINPEMASDIVKVRRFINLVGEDWSSHIILRIANDSADGGSKRKSDYLNSLYEKCQEIANDTENPVIRPRFPITAQDIMYHFKIKQGPLVGRMLAYLKDLYLDGQLLPNEKYKAIYLLAEKFNME